MSAFLSVLKNWVSILNVLIFLFLIACISRKYGRKKIAVWLLAFDLLLFWVCSTEYLPKYLARKLERQYPAFDVKQVQHLTGPVYVHVLGSGYSLDSNLHANARLVPVAQSRLMEGLRLLRNIDKSILVCSGGSPTHAETQAEVSRKAALLLGADSSRILTLDSPLTTIEEAQSLAAKVDTTAMIIIVTDAIHMPRAIKFFKYQGFKPLAAPTNYRAPLETKNTRVKWWPTLGSLMLMDVVIHEYLGDLKERL